MLLILLLFSSFLIGIGLIFTLIDLRTRFGPQFRNFSVCLTIMPGAALLDLFSFAEWIEPEARLLLQQILHLYVLPFMVFSVRFLPKVAGFPMPCAVDALFAAGALVIAPVTFTDSFLRLEGGEVSAGPAYPFTFLLYGTLYILFAYGVLIGHARTAPSGEKCFAWLHLIGFGFASGGGFMDMLVVVEPRLFFFPTCKSVGILVFGVFSAYFFADRFFRILGERDELYRRVDGLNREFLSVQPLRQIGESTALITHEIKNYLSVLKSNHLLLKDRLASDLETPEVDRMIRSTAKLESFAKSILEFSHCSQSLRAEAVDLESLIKDCVEAHFPGRSGMVRVSGPLGGQRVRGDRNRLEQVFLNLFKNSLEAGATRISVRIFQLESFAILELDDDGSGCSKADLARLGTLFFTTKRGMGGTGLGLAIVTSILHGHGGNLTIIPDRPGFPAGSGFGVRLAIPLWSQGRGPGRELTLPKGLLESCREVGQEVHED